VSVYNTAGIISKVSEDLASENAENCRCRQPHCHLTSPPQGIPSNIRINLIQPKSRDRLIGLYFCCGLYRSIFIQISVVGSERRVFSAIQYVSAVPGRPKSIDFDRVRLGQTRPTPLLGLIYCRCLRRSVTGRTAAYPVGSRRRYAFLFVVIDGCVFTARCT